MSSANGWCLRWRTIVHRATWRQRLRFWIAQKIRAEDFYEGTGYECDGEVRESFEREWTERVCEERNPDYVDPRPANDWLPRLAPSDTPLLRLLNPPAAKSSVVRWDWGTLEPVEPIVSGPPSVDQQPPPAGVAVDEPD